MNKELSRIINLFNDAQKEAVYILESQFGCSKPTSSMDFTTRCKSAIRNQNYESGEYKIRPHGIGMEININGTKIDFDFGENGEFNGFDSWRLFNFIETNKIKSTISTEEEMKELLENAISNGYIVKGVGMGNVHYVNS